MVRRLLPGCDGGEPDAADALAVAICHAHHATDPAAAGRAGMIAKLAGVVDQIEPDAAVIDVGGVGYLAFCSTRTIGRLPPPGSPARLLIETHVREDHIHLYGFIDAAERDWFRRLTTVQGVGARLALSLLSAVAPEKLGLAILAQDKAALAQAEGVGPRLAARIVNELRDKIGGIAARDTGPRRRRLGCRGERRRSELPMRSRRWRTSGSAAAEALGAVAAAARRLGSERRRRCADQSGPGGAGAMNDAAAARRRPAASRAGRSRKLGPAGRPSTNSSASISCATICASLSTRPRAAARRSTISCSSGLPGSARRPSRRSSPARWGSTSTPPQAR